MIEDIDDRELRERIVYSLMQPAIQMAASSALSLKELTHLLRVGYFHEFRGRGLGLSEICDALDISIATAARLSKDLKTNFFKPEKDHELPQLIEYMLWSEPLSAARIKQVLPKAEPEDVDAALEVLRRGERIEERDGVLRLITKRGRLVTEHWFSRVGALNSLLKNLNSVVEARFFKTEEPSLSRTLNFRISADQVEELERFYQEKLWPEMVKFDETAEGKEHKHVQLSVFWVVKDEPK